MPTSSRRSTVQRTSRVRTSSAPRRRPSSHTRPAWTRCTPSPSTAPMDERAATVSDQYDMGLITRTERHEAVVEKWNEATEEVANAMIANLDQLNPIFMMANSGARGSFKQIRQLAGMRGLMANPKGEIIERPI